MKVADICTREVVATGCSSSVQQAAALMRERHVGALVVLADSAQGTQVVGIVTDRDLVIEALARGLDATQTEVGRFADGKLAAVSAGASLDEAIAMMKKKGVRRLLVAGDGGSLFGILSLDDLLDAMAHEMSEMAYAVRGGIAREVAEREPLRAAPPVAARIPEYSF
jgi:signal-transduction protein with cAMP-binding, CBS, and nucleotidyltransferase domain